MYKGLIAAVFCLVLAGCSPPASNARIPDLLAAATGEVISLCEDCPTFVRVPDAPNGLRDIRYVTAYPLTWVSYLESVEEGACPIPDRKIRISGRLYSASDFIEDLEVDWPISILNKSEIDCYLEFLESKTDLNVQIPTEAEWNWFAAGDLDGSKYPWGDDIDAPPAAVPGVEINPEDEFVPINTFGYNRFVKGVRTGLFPPNSWGLFDLIGNQRELTSTAYSSEEWLAINPESRLARASPTSSIYMTRGGDRYSRSWKNGLREGGSSVLLSGDVFSSYVTVRIVLIAS